MSKLATIIFCGTADCGRIGVIKNKPPGREFSQLRSQLNKDSTIETKENYEIVSANELGPSL